MESRNRNASALVASNAYIFYTDPSLLESHLSVCGFKLGMIRYEKYVHQFKAVLIPELHILPKQIWTFPLHDIAINLPKCQGLQMNENWG